jgi:hypothetical protein
MVAQRRDVHRSAARKAPGERLPLGEDRLAFVADEAREPRRRGLVGREVHPGGGHTGTPPRCPKYASTHQRITSRVLRVPGGVRDDLRAVHHVGEGEDDDAGCHADFALAAHVRPDSIAHLCSIDGRGGERIDDRGAQVARVVMLGEGARGRAGGREPVHGAS